jgi:UDP-N-acetylmuramoyl-tripeptide--D-alanyl-D-alanine ligase
MHNPYIKQLKTYLYILQSAEYNICSLFKWLKNNRGKKIEQQKKELVWTAKAKIIFILTLILWGVGLLVLTVCLFLNLTWYLALIIVAIITPIWQVLLVFFLIIPTILLRPFEKIYIFFYLRKAKNKLSLFKKKNDGLKIIGVTGSYGKTTVKECLAAMLKEKYNVLATPENINTPIGVARLILNNLTEHHEIFIVEMGAYARGDIKKMCDLVYPQIGVLTGINESHLEKFNTIENTIKTKFELIESLPKEGLAIINGDNKYCSEQVLDASKKITKSAKCKIKLYFTEYLDRTKSEDSTNVDLIPVKLINYQQLESISKFAIIKENIKAEFEVKLLGKHNILNILPGVLIGEKLGLNAHQIQEGIKSIKPVPHRLQPIMSKNNILVIDDAYNGNPDGAIAAIEVLDNFNERRKIFATPGLVELGESGGEVHKKIGLRLADTADLVLLIQNSNTKFFLQGLKEKEYPDDKIKIYQSSQMMQDDLKNILRANDVILFQNDWPDNYF